MEENKKDKELRFLYKITTDDIERARTRQWSVIYFSLLVLVGIMVYYKLVEIRFAYFYWFQRPFLAILAAFVSMLGMYLLMDLQRILYVFRKRLTAITSRFEPDFQDIMEISPIAAGKESFRYWRHFWRPMLPFIILLMAGMLCVTLVVLYFHPMIILAGILIVNIPFLIWLYISNKKKLQKVDSN